MARVADLRDQLSQQAYEDWQRQKCRIPRPYYSSPPSEQSIGAGSPAYSEWPLQRYQEPAVRPIPTTANGIHPVIAGDSGADAAIQFSQNVRRRRTLKVLANLLGALEIFVGVGVFAFGVTRTVLAYDLQNERDLQVANVEFFLDAVPMASQTSVVGLLLIVGGVASCIGFTFGVSAIKIMHSVAVAVAAYMALTSAPSLGWSLFKKHYANPNKADVVGLSDNEFFIYTVLLGVLLLAVCALSALSLLIVAVDMAAFRRKLRSIFILHPLAALAVVIVSVGSVVCALIVLDRCADRFIATHIGTATPAPTQFDTPPRFALSCLALGCYGTLWGIAGVLTGLSKAASRNVGLGMAVAALPLFVFAVNVSLRAYMATMSFFYMTETPSSKIKTIEPLFFALAGQSVAITVLLLFAIAFISHSTYRHS